MNKIGDSAKIVSSVTAKTMAVAVNKIGDTAATVSNSTVQLVKDLDLGQYQFDAEVALKQIMKVPGIKINRDSFLKKELIKYYPENTVHKAIEKNPAYAGIEREKINEIAKQIITFESNKVSAFSFAAGLPGGIAIAASIPTDMLQYFGNIIIVMQKLAYLYGFNSFDLEESDISDQTLNELMILLSVMFGVQGANAGVKIIGEAAAAKILRTLPQKALTKTLIFPIVKQIAKVVGVRMTKDIYAKNISKVVPFVGGVVSGGITYATFKPSCYKLQRSFKELSLSDPNFYKDIIDTI